MTTAHKTAKGPLKKLRIEQEPSECIGVADLSLSTIIDNFVSIEIQGITRAIVEQCHGWKKV